MSTQIPFLVRKGMSDFNSRVLRNHLTHDRIQLSRVDSSRHTLGSNYSTSILNHHISYTVIKPLRLRFFTLDYNNSLLKSSDYTYISIFT